MDRERFDALARLFATTGSRRSALGALLGAGVLGTALEAEARKGKGKSSGKDRGGNGKNKDRGKSKDKNRKKRAQAELLPGNCCSTGNCTPGKGKNLGKCCYENGNVSGKNFSGANLGSANFSGADASDANFSGANLGKACLVDANLTDATINGSTNTGGAIFCRTTMPDGTTINNSGCGKGTPCCPTCDADNPCVEDGETCCNGRCIVADCCDNGEQSTCDAGEICCNLACGTGECCTNRQCDNPTPICDDDNVCVACTANGECGNNGACTCSANPEAGQCQEDFFQGFEQDTDGWIGVTRVASGTSGIPAKSGGFYAKAFGPATSTSGFTRWGGYSSVFPDDGYTTELAIYLDPAGTAATSQFDYSSAVSQPNCNHRRDFIFTAGKSAGNPSFCVSASNNSPGFPCNPARDPETLTVTGWYIFRHEFRDNGSGILAVDMKLFAPNGNLLNTWTLSDPTDIIGNTVGGNRYGWFSSNDFTFVAIDDSSRESN